MIVTIVLTGKLCRPLCVQFVFVYHCLTQVFHRDWQMWLNISSTRSSVTELCFITDRGVKRSQTLTATWLVFLRGPSPCPSNNCCGWQETSARCSSAGFSVALCTVCDKRQLFWGVFFLGRTCHCSCWCEHRSTKNSVLALCKKKK